MTELEYQFEILDFKMRMLQAEIEMQSMIAENRYLEAVGAPAIYRGDAFAALIDKHRIHDNAIPCYRG
jgi:hypothetical protein